MPVVIGTGQGVRERASTCQPFVLIAFDRKVAKMATEALIWPRAKAIWGVVMRAGNEW